MSSAQWAFGTRVSSISIMIMMTAMILTSMMTVKIFKDGQKWCQLWLWWLWQLWRCWLCQEGCWHKSARWHVFVFFPLLTNTKYLVYTNTEYLSHKQILNFLHSSTNSCSYTNTKHKFQGFYPLVYLWFTYKYKTSSCKL